MILQTEYWDLIKIFFDWVGQSAGIMVLLAGLLAITWLGYERKRRKSFTKKDVDEYEFDTTKFLRVLSYLGLILGIFCLWSGITGLILDIPPSFKYAEVTANSNDTFTSILLIILGIVMFLKPINDLPWAGIIGLLVGTVTAFIIAMIVPDTAVQWVAGFINPKWVLVIIFVIVTTLVAISVKFYINILMTISKILSWPPIALVIVIFCVVQGVALWGLGVSIVPDLF